MNTRKIFARMGETRRYSSQHHNNDFDLMGHPILGPLFSVGAIYIGACAGTMLYYLTTVYPQERRREIEKAEEQAWQEQARIEAEKNRARLEMERDKRREEEEEFYRQHPEERIEQTQIRNCHGSVFGMTRTC